MLNISNQIYSADRFQSQSLPDLRLKNEISGKLLDVSQAKPAIFSSSNQKTSHNNSPLDSLFFLKSETKRINELQPGQRYGSFKIEDYQAVAKLRREIIKTQGNFSSGTKDYEDCNSILYEIEETPIMKQVKDVYKIIRDTECYLPLAYFDQMGDPAAKLISVVLQYSQNSQKQDCPDITPQFSEQENRLVLKLIIQEHVKKNGKQDFFFTQYSAVNARNDNILNIIAVVKLLEFEKFPEKLITGIIDDFKDKKLTPYKPLPYLKSEEFLPATEQSPSDPEDYMCTQKALNDLFETNIYAKAVYSILGLLCINTNFAFLTRFSTDKKQAQEYFINAATNYILNEQDADRMHSTREEEGSSSGKEENKKENSYYS